MTAPIAIRPATKADASEIALLVNIATHGGIGMGWAHDARATLVLTKGSDHSVQRARSRSVGWICSTSAMN